MKRNYNGTHRADAAKRTRDQIVAAAFRLHGDGIIDMDALADEAGVSGATVRKHFPTRETIFENCTAYGFHLVPAPDLELIRQIEDPAGRTRQAVHEAYSFHEALLGQTWSAFKYEHESPALANALVQMENLISLIAEAVLEVWPSADHTSRGLLLAMLGPLSYRALRVDGGLTPAEAIDQTTAMLVGVLTSGASREEAAYR